MTVTPRMTDRSNKLYFEKVVSRESIYEPITEEWFWILKSPNGHVIGTSHMNYKDRNGVVRNAYTVFGKEIDLGIHSAARYTDHELIAREAEKRREAKRLQEEQHIQMKTV